MVDMGKKVIGICGYKGSGKSTAAEIIIDNSYKSYEPKHCVIHNFADPIKDMIEALGIPRENLEDAVLKEICLKTLGGYPPRHAMQTLGTEWGRNCMGKDFWVNMWELTLGVLPNVVAADLRFINEAQKIKSFRLGRIIRINRPGFVAAEHISEKGIHQITPDAVVINDDSLETFKVKVLAIVDFLYE